jgi:hypothetical protein
MASSSDRSIPKKPRYSTARRRSDSTTIKPESEYKLTFARLLKLLTERDPVSEKPPYRNRITKEPMRRSGRSTFKKLYGVTSPGSFQYHYNKNKSDDVDADNWSNFQPVVYGAMWLFIQFAEDERGKGIFDFADPEQRELRELLPDYRDIAKLNFDAAPDVREVLGDEDPDLLLLIDRLLGNYDPIAELYDRIRQAESAAKKNAMAKLKKLILLYAAENELAVKEDIAEMMLLNLADGTTKDAQKKYLIDAIASIYKLELMEHATFVNAIAPLSEAIVGFEGEEFKTIEEFLDYIGFTSS